MSAEAGDKDGADQSRFAVEDLERNEKARP